MIKDEFASFDEILKIIHLTHLQIFNARLFCEIFHLNEQGCLSFWFNFDLIKGDFNDVTS